MKLEGKEDFEVRWVCKPLRNGSYDFKELIPEYTIKCPVCGSTIYLGTDPRDQDAPTAGNGYKDAIMSRDDWESRYKVDPKIKNDDSILE